MANADGIFRACTTFQTDRGSSFVYPIVDDSTAYATIIAENATSNTSADVTFAKVDFGKCPMWRSGMVPVSWELIQDSPFDIETVLADTFGKRLARGIGRWLVLMLQASAPVAVNAASPTVVTGDELENLLDLLPEDHQQNASWLMRQSTLNAIHKLKASTGGSYLFPPAQNPAGEELLMGRPVFASPSMDALTDVGFPIAFGNLGAVVRRVVSGSLAIKAFPERNAEYGENTFESYLRSDGALLATSTNIPVVLLEASGGS
jgi:HK97 family phage major capsid protein